MKHANIVLALVCLAAGLFIGHKFFPRTVIRETPAATSKTHTITKEVVKQADGTVTERVVTKTLDRVKASPQPPKPEYRIGALIPVGSDRLPTVSASKRLFGDVWFDAQYDLRHKEATIGVSIEF